MIDVKNVAKSYGKTTVLNNISFRINPGEFVCITGPSGAGKSTLLHLLTGAEDVTKGSIEVDGVDIKAVPTGALQMFRQRLGIVFQDYKLLRNRTVAENIAFPLEVCGVPDAEIDKRVRTVLKLIELTKHAGSLPSELSVAVGRAVVHDPMIILADEPTGNIDPDQSKKVLELFTEIHESGTTIIVATHDTALVDTLNTRVIELNEGEVTRDSIGGYKASKQKQPNKKHDILEVEVDDEKDDKSKKRKVRVTSVNS